MSPRFPHSEADLDTLLADCLGGALRDLAAAIVLGAFAGIVLFFCIAIGG